MVVRCLKMSRKRCGVRGAVAKGWAPVVMTTYGPRRPPVASPVPRTVTEAIDDDLEYEARQLDRAVTATDQIRTVLETFRDRLFTEIFPGRSVVPKTLIFAKDDAHAEEIVTQVREVFGKGNDFAARITYNARNAEQQLAAFRTTAAHAGLGAPAHLHPRRRTRPSEQRKQVAIQGIRPVVHGDSCGSRPRPTRGRRPPSAPARVRKCPKGGPGRPDRERSSDAEGVQSSREAPRNVPMATAPSSSRRGHS
jgi:hypothetical protein